MLLALYAFIAAPVSLWHQHNGTSKKFSNEQNIQSVKKAIASTDANCKICGHHYAAADNDAITTYSFPVSFLNSYSDFGVLQHITNPGYSQSNKGPPQLG